MISRDKPEKTVSCPKGGFISERYLLESDNMGFTLTRTFIPKGKEQTWHYKNHLEACFCISGAATLKCNQKVKTIVPGSMYAMNNHDKHYFTALEDTVLICVFNPPLTGDELHGMDGSYTEKESNIVLAKFDDEGREYSYLNNKNVKIGDHVVVDVFGEYRVVKISQTENISQEHIERANRWILQVVDTKQNKEE